ncbi:unnamed protein product [Protopolystoma xenopodis]|uniref:Uncharacterized protein n=1 Tax=Protopolystoma xenopodis TaxID=117903 RepID=A0A3S5CMI5_9PLAT|nr:unnamed protein product [Protopolystoma xenopodis]
MSTPFSRLLDSRACGGGVGGERASTGMILGGSLRRTEEHPFCESTYPFCQIPIHSENLRKALAAIVKDWD